MSTTAKFKMLFSALLVMALWGSLFPMVKVGYAAFSIPTTSIPSIMIFAGLRFTVCGLVIVTFSCLKQKRIDLPKKRELFPIAMGALSAIILHYSFTYIGLALGEGSKSAIIKQVGFLFLSCFAFLFDKNDGFSTNKIVAGLLGFCGIIATAFDGSAMSFAVGDALLLLASACSAISTLVAKRATQSLSPVKYTGYSQLAGGIFLLVLGWALGGKIPHIDLGAIMSFLYICSASIGAYVMWNSLLRTESISKLSVIKFTEPLFAVIFSGLILGEDIFKLSYLVALVLLLLALLTENGVWKPIRKKENKK